jgi:hypothetical protein
MGLTPKAGLMLSTGAADLFMRPARISSRWLMRKGHWEPSTRDNTGLGKDVPATNVWLICGRVSQNRANTLIASEPPLRARCHHSREALRAPNLSFN